MLSTERSITRCTTFVLAALCAAACGSTPSAEVVRAVAHLQPAGGSAIRGAAVFSRHGQQVTLLLDVTQAPQGTHAVSILEGTACSADPTVHWNPTMKPHGLWGSGHLGDLGNFEVGADGTGTLRIDTDALAVGASAGANNDVVGHALVVHAQANDGQTQPSGNAGPVLACAVIQKLGAGMVDPGGVPAGAARARAVLSPRSGTAAAGEAVFTQNGDSVDLELTIDGATPGMHGVHLHEVPDCSDPGALSTGGHWNPAMAMHPMHLGDVGNLEVRADLHGKLVYSTKNWVVGMAGADGGRAANDVIGRAVIVHANVDDMATQPTGNAGGRIACGVILPWETPAQPATRAVARIDPRSGSVLTGQATFVQTGNKVQVTITARGLSPGPHGVHVHETGSCAEGAGASAGGHWNPGMMMHGAGDAGTGHTGDIDNLVVKADGTGSLTFVSDRWQITGKDGVVGRAVIIHAGPDDFTTQPTGNSGGRIGCGVVTLEGQQPAEPQRLVLPIEGRSGNLAAGLATLVEAGPSAMAMQVRLWNATPGEYALRLHEKADCASADGASAGAPFNPTALGSDAGSARVGELGTLVVGAGGSGLSEVLSVRWQLRDGGAQPELPRSDDGGFADRYADGGFTRFDLVGRSLVVHGPNAGPRVGCGEIR